MEKSIQDENEQVNILLVDDSQRNLDSLTEILKDPEYNIFQALSGEQALGIMLKESFAVIILDVMMPGMDGFDLAGLIKSRKVTEDVPIIFLTGINTSPEDMFHGYSLGACDYLIKPINHTILKAKVAVFVGQYKRNQSLIRQYEGWLGGVKELIPSKADTSTWDHDYSLMLISSVKANRINGTYPTKAVEEFAVRARESGLASADVAQLHIRCLKEITANLSVAEAMQFALDSRLILLELMGGLVDQYRNKLLLYNNKD